MTLTFDLPKGMFQMALLLIKENIFFLNSINKYSYRSYCPDKFTNAQQEGKDGPGSLPWIFERTIANFSLSISEKNLQE